MFSIFKKFFGHSEAQPAGPAVPASRPRPISTAQAANSGAPVPNVQVAHLSLAAIVARFPAEMKALVLQEPAPDATIALPLQLIHKQLASGSVKMSLASLHRQAPAGVLAPLAPGDKRQVEIPLKEIFRHVHPQTLKKREDQRPLADAENDFNLFGDAENPYAIAPITPDDAPPLRDSTNLHFSPPSRFGSMDPATPLVPEPPVSRFAPAMPARSSIAAPATNGHGANGNGKTHSDAPPVTLALAPLACAWPAEICGELLALDPATTVTLDGAAVSAGLAKGKVVFTWSEICAGLQPPPAVPTVIAPNTELVLPLKVVAPAYLATTKTALPARKAVELDETIPELFNGGTASPPKPAVDLVAAPDAPAEEEIPTIPPAEPLPAPAVLPEAPQSSTTVGELFGEPAKHEFTPVEIVAGTVKLPGVTGAVVALQEGLQVAAALPEGIKSEVVAAFLPQIFARLNQYSGEMQLGDVDEVLFTTNGAHCQIYRLGFVYFAVFGQPGVPLPWAELQIIAAELGRQTH